MEGSSSNKDEGKTPPPLKQRKPSNRDINDPNDTERLATVEETLGKAVSQIGEIDRSIASLTSKLDVIFAKVMGYPPTTTKFMTKTTSRTDDSGEEVEEEINIEKLEEVVEEHQRLFLNSTNEDFDDLEVQSDNFPTVEKKDVPIVINESDAWKINPKNRFRLCWDLCLVMPMLVYLCVAMPFRLCFGNEAPVFSAVYFWEFLIDMIFLVDICFNFFTGYFVGKEDVEDGDLIEFDAKRIAYNYMTSWFVLDVVSGIPFSLLDLLMNQDAGALKSAKTFKLLRFLRFLKLGRLLKFEKIFSAMDRDTLDTIEDILQNSNTRTAIMLTKLAVILGLVCHFMSCGFVLIGRASLLVDQPSWLEFTLHGPYTARDTTGKNGNDAVNSIYIAAFYYCITTMTSVGYGDIIPVSNSERIFAMILEFVGAITFAMIIASLTSIITSMDMNTRKTAEQLDAVASFVEVRQFPEDLGKRIRRHFRHFYSLKSAIDETEIFNNLSSSLRKEVSKYLVVELMGQESFFMTIPTNLWSLLLPLLRPMRFEKDEKICNFDEDCYEMHVVITGYARGECYVPGIAEPRMRHIIPGGSINVLCVLNLWSKCVETVTATTAVETYTVSDSDFTSLFKGSNDHSVWERLQIKESLNFKMDRTFCSPSAKFGKPLYFACFSTIEIGLSALKCSRGARRGVENWLVVQLVDQSGFPLQDFWRMQTEKATRQEGGDSQNVLTWNHVVKWDDITPSFSRTSLRVRLFEESGGMESIVAELVLPMTQLSSDITGERLILFEPTKDNGSLRQGEIEGWFPMNSDIEDETHRLASPMRSNQSSQFKSTKWDKFQSSKSSSVRVASNEDTKYNVKLRILASRPEKEKLKQKAKERKLMEKTKSFMRASSFTRSPSITRASPRTTPPKAAPVPPLEINSPEATL